MITENPYLYLSDQMKRGLIKSDSLKPYLDLFLYEAQELFGPRIEPYPYELGYIWFGGKSPQVFIKESAVEIRLSRRCSSDPGAALWQLTHECVHLLSPVLNTEITVLEEGLACWHEQWWIRKCPSVFPDWIKKYVYSPRYRNAYSLVKKLMQHDINCIKRIREVEPTIAKISSGLILENVPGISEDLAKSLVSKFNGAVGLKKPAERLSALRFNYFLNLKAKEQHLMPTDDFYSWASDAGFSIHKIRANRLFKKMPVLVLQSSSEAETTIFRRTEISKNEGQPVTIAAFMRAINTYWSGQLFINIWNGDTLLFNYITSTHSLPAAWTYHHISFLLPPESKILEIGALLKHGKLWLANFQCSEDYQHNPLIPLEQLAEHPTNLDFAIPLEKFTFPTGWVRVFGTDCANGQRGAYKVVGIIQKNRDLKTRCLELRSHEGYSTDFCMLKQYFLANNFLSGKITYSGVARGKNIKFASEAFIEILDSNDIISLHKVALIKNSNWTKFEVKADVPNNASRLAIGVRLYGSGTLLISNLELLLQTSQ